MRPRTFGPTAAAILIVAVTTVGAAASLGGLNYGNLGAGGTAVSTCDANGVTVAYTVAGGLVTQVTIGDIDAVCIGGQLSLTLADSSGASIGSGGPQTVSASSHLLTMSPQPGWASVAAVHVIIAGP